MRAWFKLNWSSKFVLLVEYDGTRYHGFQWQAGVPTIQDELERAIGRICERSGRVMGASRTDAGVHAKGQVVSFWTNSSLEAATLVRAMNYYLPSDISVRAGYKSNDDFNVRRDASNREYRYYILNRPTRSPFSQRFALFSPGRLDVEAMREGCRLLEGEHDFASFVPSLDDGRSTWRTVYDARVVEEGDFIVFRVVGNSFLPRQIRNMVGLLMRLGSGKMDLGDFRAIMEARCRGLAGPSSRACGLWLTRVNYPRSLGEGM